jgi:hypothetical protein
VILTVDGDSPLIAALNANFHNNRDVFLTLRDGEGKVLWSSAIEKWSRHLRDAEIHTLPIEDVIERELQSARIGLKMGLHKIGVL